MSFTLEKADSKEFARWWAVYRHTNEDFSQSFADQYGEIEDVPYCHWIMSDRQRVGGMIMVNNNIGDFFLIPPFDDAYSALKAILPKDKPLHAQSILSEHVHAFQMLGFQVEESRRWMIRPTQPYSVSMIFQRNTPDPAQTDAIAQLMFDAFHGGTGQYGQRDIDAHRRSVENYFDSVQSGDTCHQASSVLFDDDRLISACLVQPYKSHASVRFVITHLDYQHRGFARRLMEFAIDRVHGEYNTIVIAVTVSNPAEGLYHRMGFLPGPIIHTLNR